MDKERKNEVKQYNYKVVGVTFPARDGSDRQESLKELFEEELQTEDYLRSHNVKFEGYDYKGADAIAVFVDNKEIGNISADKVEEVAEIAQKASSCKVTLSLNGHDVEDYEYIVDQYKNKKEWKETDPFFDAEEANEKYNEMMAEIKEKEIYSAVLHFIIKEESDEKEKIEKIEKIEKEYPLSFLYLSIALGVILILLSVVLMLAKPIIGIIGVILGVVYIIWIRKKIKVQKSKKQ